MSANAGSNPLQNSSRARDRRWSRLVAAAALALAFDTAAHAMPPSAVTIDVYDRTQGETLAIHPLDSQRYVVGTPGHEYAMRIRNGTSRRILAVTSVDGVNVVTGETAAPEQSGYVIEACGSVEIAGWRKSLERTAAFYFTDLGDSYAARTGRPRNVGVIGVAVFHEVLRPMISSFLRDKIVAHENEGDPRARAERADAAAPRRTAPRTPPGNPAGSRRASHARCCRTSSGPVTAATRRRCVQRVAIRARDVGAGGDDLDPVRSARQPDRDGRAAAATIRAANAGSVPRDAFRPCTALKAPETGGTAPVFTSHGGLATTAPAPHTARAMAAQNLSDDSDEALMLELRARQGCRIRRTVRADKRRRVSLPAAPLR